MQLTKHDYMILVCLYDDNCITPMLSYTTQKLSKRTSFSSVKIRSSLKQFLQLGFIEKGLSEKNATTFFITNKGIEELKKLKGEKEYVKT